MTEFKCASSGWINWKRVSVKISIVTVLLASLVTVPSVRDYFDRTFPRTNAEFADKDIVSHG